RWPRDWSSDVCSSDLFRTTAISVSHDPPIPCVRCRIRRPIVFHAAGIGIAACDRDGGGPELASSLQELGNDALNDVTGLLAQWRSEERRVGKEGKLWG